MKNLKSLFDRLEGYKTYIVVVVALLVLISESFEWVSPELSTSLLTYMGLAGLAALKHGQSRLK